MFASMFILSTSVFQSASNISNFDIPYDLLYIKS